MSEDKGDYLPPAGDEVGFNFRKPYVIPAGNKLSFNLKYLWYHPPKGNKIAFNFTQPYTPPKGNELSFNFSNDEDGDTPVRQDQYVYPEGFFSELLGDQRIWLRSKWLNPTGFASLRLGEPYVRNLVLIAKPISFNASTFGTPKIINKNQWIHAPSINAELFGKPRISFWLQSAAVRQQDPFSIYGKPMVTHGVRYVEQTNSPLFTRFGAAWLSHSPRYIEPRGIFEMFPSRHQVGTSRQVFVQGFDALRFGTRIIPESQSIYPQGFSTLFGDNKIENYRQYTFPKGFLTYGTEPQHRFGYGKVYNSDQYINPTSSEFGPLFGKQLNIFNRNRTIQTHGQPQTQFGYARLDNNARLVGPQGIPSPIEVEKTNTMVAYRIRSFKMQGIEPPYISSRHIIHLGARLIAAQSQELTLFGQPGVVNTRRYYTYIGLGIQSNFGKPMIADAIRHLKLESDYAIQPPVIPLPTVIHGQRRVEMLGLDSVRYGDAYVVSKFNKATPRWNHIERVGEPVIKNVTPEVRMWGLKDDLYGKPYIGHYTRYVAPQGLNAQIFGRLRISDSKQAIDLTGFGLLSQSITRLHEIKRLQTDDYLPKRITPTGIAPIEISKTHAIRHNVLRPDSSKPMTLFGNTKIVANTIRVEPGYWEILIGKPTIELANRQVKVAAGLDFMAFGMPRMSPHTIYAVMEAPPQAIKNHVYPGHRLHYVDGLDGDRLKEPGVEFGRPSITHKQRFIYPVGNELHRIGTPFIKNAREIIRPPGLNSLRIGVISPLGTQEVRFRSQGMLSLYGYPAIKHIIKPDPYVRPAGMSFTLFGKPSIDFFNRTIRVNGFDSMRMGTRKVDDRPYLWQGLRIGAHVPITVGGQIHSQFGAAWISFKVREIRAGGEDFSHVNEYDPYHFKQRMFVWNRNQPSIPGAQIIGAKGFDNFATRVPDIRPAAHYIRPDGNMDNYRKGGF